MTEKLKNIIQEEVMKLPKEGQEAINAFNWVKITEEVGNKFSFDEIELNNFQVETLLVLVGTTDPEFYATNIENQVSTTKDVAEKITDEVMQKIFTPINDIFLDNIKKSGKAQNAKPEQHLNFILSGGDYSAFINSPLEGYSDTKSEGGGRISPSPSQGEGLGMRSGEVNYPPRPLITKSTPEERNNIPKKPKMNDIKSKFTI